MECTNCGNDNQETITIINNVQRKCEECGEDFLIF